ncbi:DNA-directed RNA polymerase III subunit RPC4 [Drosophila pseudoobscura]|uniref:DNA-directed RNA polymerase III subunit RPC4 n=1 Tax=Drosophila pseudoobscura pseudoobscura TaxID=46245 RepID=A0A6I8UE10_DROPS|nr:DNA-directed RNA polymerase III subunit RPC4 [Drosophila pseudoobscura]
MPAKRMTVTTATTTKAPPAPVAGVSSQNSTSAGGATARPLEMLNGMTRLTPARDLTLGGRGASNKKVFAPNLNAVRNKNVNVKTSKDFTQVRGGKRGGRGTASGATRGRGGNSTLIQTTGLFSEGAGVAQLRRSAGNGTAYARASEEQAVARKRTDRKDEKAQALRVRALLGESDASEGDASEPSDTEADKTELALKPILLREGLWLTQKPIVKKEDANVGSKEQDPLTMAQQLQHLHVTAQTAVMDEPPLQYGRYPRTIGGFLDAPQSQIFLLQLPNVLPCVSDEAEDGGSEAPKKEEAPAASETEPNSPAAPASIAAPRLSVLRQLEEGQIGKILRYRSGRVKLLLGDTHFDLDMGLDPGFLQELMSVTANREARSGDMYNLGPIQAKIKATPDWVHLFEQQESSKRNTSTAPSTSLKPPTA